MKNILYLISIILLFSCKNENDTFKDNVLTIPEDILSTEKTIPLNTVCKNIFTIPLQTDSHILIKAIRNIYLYQNKLFILHDDQISCFDMNGNFLRKIGHQGNGPGEFYYLPEGIAFHNSHIYLNDQHSKKILIYSIEGDYIKSIVTNHVFSQFKILNHTLLIGYTPNKLGNEPNKLYTYNMEGIVIDSLKNSMIYDNYNAIYSFSYENPLFSLNNKLLGFKEVLSDTIYKINPDFSLDPFLVFNLGDLKLHPDDIYNQKDIFKALDHGKKVLEVLFDNENYMIIKDWDTRFTILVWDKKNNNIDNVKFLYSDDLAKSFNKEKSYIYINPKDESSKVMTKDGTAYFMPEFVSEDNKYLIGYETSAAHEEDNPIIVLAEMK